jgi:hypothetical protein
MTGGIYGREVNTLFELELHDLIPYLISICLLYTLVYSCGAFMRSEGHEHWQQDQTSLVVMIVIPHRLLSLVPVRHWLVRKVKRKESPDDDSSACISSFAAAPANKRGGFQCSELTYSLPQSLTVLP